MKKRCFDLFKVALIALGWLALTYLLGELMPPRTPGFEARAHAATASLLMPNPFPPHQRGAICSGTLIAPKLLLTARHCTIEERTGELYPVQVSFADNEQGPFYDVWIKAISQTDDLALLGVVNGDIPPVALGDEKTLKLDDPIFNISFPQDSGKLTFRGRFMAPAFPHFPRDFTHFPEWMQGMPFDVTIAHGSSGSGLFDPKSQTLIGVVVGTYSAGSFNVAIPASRAWNLLTHIKENSLEAYLNKLKSTPHEQGPFDLP